MRLDRPLNKIPSLRYFHVLLRWSSWLIALQTQSQPVAANESGDTDLTNLATVVDELQGSRSGSATSRDISLVVARLLILLIG
jgi:hypothetical protein